MGKFYAARASLIQCNKTAVNPGHMGDLTLILLNQTPRPHGWGLVNSQRHLLLTTPNVKSPVRVLVETMVKSPTNSPYVPDGGELVKLQEVYAPNLMTLSLYDQLSYCKRWIFILYGF